MVEYAKPDERTQYAQKLITLLVPVFPQNTQFDSDLKDDHIRIRADEPDGRSVLIRISQNAQDDELMQPPPVGGRAEQKFVALIREKLKHRREKHEQWDITAKDVHVD